MVGAEALNGEVEIEEQRTLAVVTNHALNPEERAKPRAACDRRDVMMMRDYPRAVSFGHPAVKLDGCPLEEFPARAIHELVKRGAV